MHGHMTATDQARPKPKQGDDGHGRDGRDERGGWESEWRGCRVALGLNWEGSQLTSSSSSVASVI